MSIDIRRAVRNDIQQIFLIENKAFPSYQKSSKRSLLLSITSPFQEMWILEKTKNSLATPLGYISFHVYARTLRVFSIAILPEYQKIGYGKKLLKHAVNCALANNQEKITLEADATNEALMKWYQKNGFKKIKFLEHYYAPNQHAYKFSLQILETQETNRTINVIVVDNPKKWTLSIENVQLISAHEYTSNKYYSSNSKKIRVFNLCNSYRYQSLGYYVSLLASARDQRVIPNVTTIRDFQDVKIIRSITHDIEKLIQNSLEKLSFKQISFNVYFGNTVDAQYQMLGNKLYQMFEAPLFQVSFVRTDKWSIKKIHPLSLHKIQEEDFVIVQKFAQTYFSSKRFVKQRLKNYTYDLAILINPDEKNPPSCKKSLQLFKKTAENMGFYTEFITKQDYNRISEFDALFIRETTNVNNHTYQFSRKAYAEGLVVIDDPWSILRCSNKIYLEERLTLNKIHTPKSVIIYKHEPRNKYLDFFSFPIVLKQPDSAFSIGVVKVNSAQEYETALHTFFKISDLIIAQEFLPSDYDWRIGVLDQRPLFACKYYMAKGHWQIYNWEGKQDEISGDSQTIPIEDVPEDILDTATKAASLMGDGLYGVDLKKIGSKVYVIEVNDNPNIDKGIEDAVLKNELYVRIISSIQTRIEMSRNIARFISTEPK